MDGSVVYQTVLTYLRKDRRGLSLSLDEFNTVSRIVDKRVLLAFMARFEEDIEITSHMGMLKVLDYPITLSSGVTTLPLGYFRMIGDPHYVDSGGVTRYLDIVTSMEHVYRERDYLTKSSLKYPTCVIGAEDVNKVIEIRVYPTTITNVYIDYIRDTNTPFLDYYINNTKLQATYLTAGQQNITIPTGSTYRDGTTGIKNSITVDWDWDFHELPWVTAYFLQALGGIIPDELLLQIGMKDSQEIQTGKIW